MAISSQHRLWPPHDVPWMTQSLVYTADCRLIGVHRRPPRDDDDFGGWTCVVDRGHLQLQNHWECYCCGGELPKTPSPAWQDDQRRQLAVGG